MVVINGITVKIRADGQDLNEYGADDVRPDPWEAIKKYVEICSDRTFTVVMHVAGDHKWACNALSFSISHNCFPVDNVLILEKDVIENGGFRRHVAVVPERELSGKVEVMIYRLHSNFGIETGSGNMTDPQGTDESNYTYVDDHPFALLDFEYRSRSKCHRQLQSSPSDRVSALQDLGIIPRTPSPPRLEERDLESLTPEELKELAHRRQVHLS